MTPLVSVVIPIYNGEKFIDAIYQNFSEQTYKEWELIFVNDISTDGTLELIMKYADKDSRVRVLDRKSKGGTAAKGLEYAIPYCKGDYFFFMSHDDFMDSTFLEDCVKKSIDTGADIVVPNLVLYWDESKKIKHGEYPIGNNYESSISGRDAFYMSLNWRLHGNAFRKMELVRKIGYKADYYNSCEYYGRIMYLHANKIVFCDTNFYYRQSNPNAITKTFHYFQVDILTTDLMLYEIMSDAGYGKDLQRERLKAIGSSFWQWSKTCLRTEMRMDERIYMIHALASAAKRLVVFWIKSWGRS